MGEMVIITNNVPRDILDGMQLTDKEREEFDYLNWPAIEEGTDSASFFRYKGEVYDLGTFMRYGTDGWDGIANWSFSNGLLVKYVNDYESVIVAYYYVKG